MLSGLRRSHLYFFITEEESFIFWSGLRRSHLYVVRTEEESFKFCQD
jgi:hypothetical protein